MSTAEQNLACIIRDLNEGWEPHDAQQVILNTIFSQNTRIVQVDCGRKFGKTDLALYFLFRLALTVPGAYYYIGPFAKEAAEIVWESGRMQNFVDKKYLASKPRDSDRRMKLINGSFIKVDGADNHEAYRGVNPHGIVYDEFKDFKIQFHEAMEPNLATYNAPLLILGTPPKTSEMPKDQDGINQLGQYDQMIRDCKTNDGMEYFNFPSWCNPHISTAWLKATKKTMLARDDAALWYREYEAKRVKGGKGTVFPMFDRDTHVIPHDKIMEMVVKDRSKLDWYVIADPGSTTVFAMLFMAVNRYERCVYVLDEIYAQSLAETSTGKIIPKMKAKRDDLFPGWESMHITWLQFCDEAAAWFMNEASQSFAEGFLPTQKKLHDKIQGLSLIKDILVTKRFFASDRCAFLAWEMENYKRDDNGKIAKKDDHLIDCLRYGNAAAGIRLLNEAEPKDPLEWRRFHTPSSDQDHDDLQSGKISDYPVYVNLEDLS